MVFEDTFPESLLLADLVIILSLFAFSERLQDGEKYHPQRNKHPHCRVRHRERREPNREDEHEKGQPGQFSFRWVDEACDAEHRKNYRNDNVPNAYV